MQTVKEMSELPGVNFAGITLSNPLIIASATPGWDGFRLATGGSFGPGAVVTKTLIPTNQIKQHPRSGRYRLIRLKKDGIPIGMVNADTMSNQPLEDWLESHLQAARKGGAKVFVSVACLRTPEATAQLAKTVAKTGQCDLLELNASCPMEGNVAGSDPKQAFQHVQAIKQTVDLPLTFKLSAGLQDLIAVVDAVMEAGADGLVMTNSVSGFAGVDIETGKPLLPCLGGYTGPAIKPIVQGILVQVASHMDVPIAAVGGITCWEDVVEYIFLGATTVEIATGIMWQGYELIPRVLKGLSSYFNKQGYSSWEDIRGRALRDVVSLEEYASGPRRTAVTGSTCVQCGTCVTHCFYGAISLANDSYVVDPTKCDGCGICIEWCPQRAIQFGKSPQAFPNSE